jgi:hypothetical protein
VEFVWGGSEKREEVGDGDVALNRATQGLVLVATGSQVGRERAEEERGERSEPESGGVCSRWSRATAS